MTICINPATGEYPITSDMVRARNPQTILPADWVTWAGLQVVFPAPRPEAGPLERVEEIAPVLTDKGHWEQRWQVIDVTAGRPAEEADALRAEALAAAKRAALTQIKARRDDIELRAAFEWRGYHIQGDELSLDRMRRTEALLREAISRGTPEADAVMAWRTTDNQWTPPLGPDDLVDMAYTKGQQGLAAWAAFAVHEAAIMACESIEAVSALDLSAGWPVGVDDNG